MSLGIDKDKRMESLQWSQPCEWEEEKAKGLNSFIVDSDDAAHWFKKSKVKKMKVKIITIFPLAELMMKLSCEDLFL